MPFHYELVVARLCKEDAGQSQSQNVLEHKHGKAFLLAEALHFRVDEGVDGSNEEIPTIRFSWLDVLSPISKRFEFVISSQHTGCSRSDIEQVQDLIVQCIWEGENEKYSLEAPEEELLAIKQAFNIPHPQADITHPTSPPDTEKPPPLHLVKQSNKVIWVDIGTNLEETYWWPALVYESNLRSYVALMPNLESKLVDINPKFLDSIKVTKPFKAHLLCDPVELNPIFKTEGLAVKYPTKTSFNEAYNLITREKCVIHSFQEDNEELPDVSAFMIPLSQESRAVLSNIFFREEINKNRPASPELDNLNDEVCDEPDQEIKIPGEIVLCQSNGESQEFWSAMPDYNLSKVDKSLKNQPSSRRKPTVFNFLIITSSSLLDLHFGLLIKRSFIGSEIVNQKSSDPILISKHENFSTLVKNRGLIPEDVRYGKYCEDTLHKVGMFFTDRYLLNDRLESEEGRIIAMDPRFSALSEADKTQYIFDILVPELIRLITVTQYLEDRREELISELGGSSREELEKDELMNQKILEEAKKLAHLDICEVDLVDKVISFQTQNLSSNLPTPTPSASSSIDFAKDGQDDSNPAQLHWKIAPGPLRAMMCHSDPVSPYSRPVKAIWMILQWQISNEVPGNGALHHGCTQWFLSRSQEPFGS
ncbi:hypothetical protein PSTG_13992 [Puccinia striiformis f. sp. tritici PST-78]|uniref:Vid27 N-terminal domain-containing protein n=1 Tax=Puccinia striiformis f. sp. tritici PST-78 TaxID=1165861 RepID=A0A0L0V097_9BASI|nr:hypothetical protein PSTG_13992 [Puccinia striiformis f. sp. tritici PST-78]